MALFKPYKVLSSQLDLLPIKEGQLIVTSDDGALYMDIDSQNRISIAEDETLEFEIVNSLPTGSDIDPDKIYLIAGSGGGGGGSNVTYTLSRSGNTVTLTGSDSSTSSISLDAVPTKVSDLDNDSGFITEITNANVITALGYTPYNATNPNGYITNSVNNLTNYYTKTEVDGKVSSVYKYKGTVANYSALPSSGLTTGDVYNIENADAAHGIKAGDNVAWNGSAWDKLGGDIDLSGYQTKIDSTHKLSSDLIDDSNSTNKFVTANEKTTWNNKQNAITSSNKLNVNVIDGLATVATTGSYNNLTDTPTIPDAVTESTISGWGFTKNTGTYSKPNGGIPKTDLASAVQTSLEKADTALQSETYTGTITGITMNGVSKGTSGVVDLGTVITAHQDISGKEDKTNKVTSLSSSSTDTQYPSAKVVYDNLQLKQDTLVSGTNIKTINNESVLGNGNIDIETIAVKHIDATDNTQWDSEHDQPTQSVLQDIAINEYYVLSVENIPTGEQGETLCIKVYLAAKFDGNDVHLRQYIRFEEGDPEENDPTGIQTFTIGNLNPEQPTVYQFTTDTTAFTKDVQINGTSIINDNVANIVTNTAYNASSNKIATMSDVENSVDLSSYSAGDTISDSTIIAKLKRDNVIITNETSKYRMADYSNGLYLYTVMNQLDGGDYILLAESGDNLIVYQKDSTYWQLRIDANNKLNADLVDDTNTTHKFVTANDKTTWNGKQDALISGTNIKTINNNSLLGTGNVSLVEGTVVVSNTEPSDPNAEVWIDTSESGVIESKFKNKTWHSKAHRGNIVGHEDTLRENTLGAYYNAFLKGADVIEVDARLSSDNIFMCNHDAAVTDINEVTYTIANTPAATLQALVLSTDSVYGNQGVPTLESVLKLAYTCGMKVDIDLKMFDSGMSDSQKRTFASNVAKLVAKCGMKGKATYAIVNGGALAIPEIIAIDPEASFVTTKANLDAISNLSTILPNYKDKCYAYTADLTASTVDAIRNAGYRLELISITADNFSTAIQFYPDTLEYLHTTDFRTIEDAYFNSVILY